MDWKKIVISVITIIILLSIFLTMTIYHDKESSVDRVDKLVQWSDTVGGHYSYQDMYLNDNMTIGELKDMCRNYPNTCHVGKIMVTQYVCDNTGGLWGVIR